MGRGHWRSWWAINWERALPAVVGISLMAASIVLGLDSSRSPYSIALLSAGVLLVVIAILLVRLKRFEAGPTGLKAELSDWEASAKAADADVPEALVEQQIQSDDTGLPTQSEEDPDVIGTLNFVAGSVAASAVLDFVSSDSPLGDCDLRLFLYDETAGRLLPALDHKGSSEGWEPGKGATGVAYTTGEYVLVQGSAVSDSTYDLSPEQQERYRELTAVAAAPVFNAGGSVIAVLAASTTSLEQPLATDEAQRDHTLAALLLSRLLVELLKWFDDR